jgi:drug/metabolite transporter (DMT)-like permease
VSTTRHAEGERERARREGNPVGSGGRVDGADGARLVALAALWGASFIFMRVLAPALGPLFTAMSRVLIAGITLVVYARATGFDAGLGRNWRRYAAIGIVGSALPFALFSFAALRLPASYLAILNAATPFFVLVLAARFAGERLTAFSIGGIGLGFVGVALVSGAGPVEVDGGLVLAIGASLGATFCYAANAVYIRLRAGDLAPRAIAGWSQVGAGIALLPATLLAPLPPLAAFTPLILVNMAGLAILCSALAYLLYYRLIADIGPTRALTVTFLIPPFGMLWGALILGETITWPMIAGCLLVLGGTGLVLRRAPPR